MFIFIFLIQLTQAATPAEIAQWMNSVVLIITGPSYCSGVLIDDQGTVATAYHCVSTGQASLVQLENGEQGKSTILAADPSSDLALLVVPDLIGKGPALLIREDPPQRGETVYALGHPFAPLAERKELGGTLRWSVSKGIISAIGDTLIQTDAALNPGNSGGPVVDEQGRIIGIASRKLQGDNISFLAPSRLLQLLNKEKTPMGFLAGQWLMGSSYDTIVSLGGGSAFTLSAGASLRDRLIVSGSYSFDINSSSTAWRFGSATIPFISGTISLRQRFGRGIWSSTIDIGGGGYVLSTLQREEDFLTQQFSTGQGAFLRLGFSGIGMRYGMIWVDDQQLEWISIDFESPGVIGFF